MPFYLVGGQDDTEDGKKTQPSAIPEPSQVPLFLIPGITGVGSEFQSLIARLRKAGDKRPIYVYYDPSIAPDPKGRPYKENSTLVEQAKLMAETMKDRLPLGPTPYVMIAYSYGCSLAALAAQQLNAEGQVVKLFLIDGPSPECSRDYFSQPSPSVTTDLINIVKYVAKLSIREAVDETFEFKLDLDFNQLVTKSPLDCMETVAQEILRNHGSILDHEFFIKSLNVAKLGINNLITSKIESPSHKIEKAYALITQQTAKKYNSTHLGWEKYAETLSLIVDKDLNLQEHTELLNDNGGADRLATKIKSFTSREITPEQLLEGHLEFIRNRYLVPSAALAASPSTSEDSTPSSSPPLTPRVPRGEEVDSSRTTIEAFSDDDTHTEESTSSFAAGIVNKLDELKKIFTDKKQRLTLFQPLLPQPVSPHESAMQPAQTTEIPLNVRV